MDSDLQPSSLPSPRSTTTWTRVSRFWRRPILQLQPIWLSPATTAFTCNTTSWPRQPPASSTQNQFISTQSLSSFTIRYTQMTTKSESKQTIVFLNQINFYCFLQKLTLLCFKCVDKSVFFHRYIISMGTCMSSDPLIWPLYIPLIDKSTYLQFFDQTCGPRMGVTVVWQLLKIWEIVSSKATDRYTVDPIVWSPTSNLPICSRECTFDGLNYPKFSFI